MAFYPQPASLLNIVTWRLSALVVTEGLKHCESLDRNRTLSMESNPGTAIASWNG
jgi:hypothetical protein